VLAVSKIASLEGEHERRFALPPSYARDVREIKTGVLREIVKDQAAGGHSSITAPTLLRRLQLDEPIEQARAFLRDVLAELESDEVWAPLSRALSPRDLRRLVGGIADADVELSALLEEDF
jgi:hypothetical protein